MLQQLVQGMFLQMASVSINPPSSDGTVTDYANVTGLTLVRSSLTVTSSDTIVVTMTSPNFDIIFNENYPQIGSTTASNGGYGTVRTPDNIPAGETWAGLTGTYGANINGLTANGFTFNNTGNLATGNTQAIGSYSFYRMTNPAQTRSDARWIAYFWEAGGMFKKRVSSNTSPDTITEPGYNPYSGGSYVPQGYLDISYDHAAYSNHGPSGRLESVSVPSRLFTITNNNSFDITFSPSGTSNTVTVSGNGGTGTLQVYNTNEAWSIESSEGASLSGSGSSTENIGSTSITYVFTNNTGSAVTIEGNTISNGSSAAIGLVGTQFNIIYDQSAYGEETTTTVTTTDTTTTTQFSGPFYVYATGATGFGVGLTGYFYPLYTDTSSTDLSSGFHVHTFTEYTDYTFYMPNSSMNHAVANRPIDISKFVTGDPILDAIEPALLNPDYATLLAQIAAETDATKKASLENQAYRFVQPLTQEEQDLFGYINSGYIDENPSNTDGTPTNFLSYVGVYYDEVGRNTGSDGQQIQVAVTSESTQEYTSDTSNIVAEYGIGEYGVNEYGG